MDFVGWFSSFPEKKQKALFRFAEVWVEFMRTTLFRRELECGAYKSFKLVLNSIIRVIDRETYKENYTISSRSYICGIL
jgi:hypothetical protein